MAMDTVRPLPRTAYHRTRSERANARPRIDLRRHSTIGRLVELEVPTLTLQHRSSRGLTQGTSGPRAEGECGRPAPAAGCVGPRRAQPVSPSRALRVAARRLCGPPSDREARRPCPNAVRRRGKASRRPSGTGRPTRPDPTAKEARCKCAVPEQQAADRRAGPSREWRPEAA
jgi:hypothetical protein